MKRSLGMRAVALWLAATLVQGGCVLAPLPARMAGLPDYHGFGVVTVPGGLYNVAGGNLLLRRADVSVDTRIRPGEALQAAYSSARPGWHWSHQMRFDGQRFVDRDGADFDTSGVSDGSTLPGTHWVRVDADTMKTKGGLAHDFDASGRLDAVYWTSDPYPRLRFVHAADRVEQRECTSAATPIDACRLVFSIVLGPHGPLRVVDEESAAAGISREAHYAYDALGRLAVALSPFDLEHGLPGTRYTYESGGQVASITSPEGVRVEYRWAFGWLLQVTQVGEGDPSHAFTPPQVVDEVAGLFRVVHANPLGGQTAYTFRDGGQVVEIDRLDAGERMTIDWDPPHDRPTRIVDFAGTTRRLEAWVDDDPTRIVLPSGNRIELVYAPSGVDRAAPFSRPIAQVSDDLGPVWSIGYDADGRPESFTNGEGETQSWSHVGAQLSQLTAASGDWIRFTSYGVHGRWKRAETSALPDTPVQRKLDRIGNVRVPAAGLQEGGVLERAYDPLRALASLEVGATDENGAVIGSGLVEIERRGDGQARAVRRPAGADHELEYDALGRAIRLRERVDGVWRDTRFSYDAAGHVIALERPNGMREEIDRDAYGRPVERRLLRDGGVEDHARFEWSAGRLDRWYDSVRDQWETFVYDGAGRVTQVEFSTRGETLSHAYDLRSRVVEKVYAYAGLERRIGIAWDLADRRTRVFTLDSAGQEQDVVRPEYQDGRLRSLAYGNGLRRENLFDAAGRFVGTRTTHEPSGEIVEETSLVREAQAGPTRMQVTTTTETALALTEEEYWLGLGGSLQQAERKIGARVFRWRASTWVGGTLQDADERSYAWDVLGNPADDGEGDVFVYNAERNRLLSADVDGTSHGYAYDDAGFVTERDGLPFHWTPGGRLARVGPAGSALLEVDWDLAGRPARVSVLGATRELVLFGGRVELDATSGAPGWLHLAHASLPFVGEERVYRHLDPLGNVGVTSDENGAITSHRRYHPFGLDRVYGSDDFIAEARGFAGGIELRHQGVATGLVVLGARVLDSDVGRFLSQDPIFDLLNAYSYAYGNPVDYEDAGGRLVDAKTDATVAAALEAKAAALDRDAAALNAAASSAFVVAAILAVVAAGSGGAAGIAAGLVAVGGTKLQHEAAAKQLEAAELRALAARLRLEIAAGELAAPFDGPGLRFGDCGWCDGVPETCGPPRRWEQGELRAFWLAGLLLALATGLCLNGAARRSGRRRTS